jgi:anti-sigma factor RsiW
MTRENGFIDCPVQGSEGAGLLLEFLDRRLEPDLSARLERHIAVCADCSRVVNAQRSVWEALDNWEPERISADFDHRLFARLEQEDAREDARRQGVLGRLAGWFSGVSLRPAIPVAAMCVVLMGVFLYRPGQQADPGQPAVVAEQVSVDAEQVETTLADLDMLQQLGVGQADESVGRQSM